MKLALTSGTSMQMESVLKFPLFALLMMPLELVLDATKVLTLPMESVFLLPTKPLLIVVATLGMVLSVKLAHKTGYSTLITSVFLFQTNVLLTT